MLHKHAFISSFLQSSLILTENRPHTRRGTGGDFSSDSCGHPRPSGRHPRPPGSASQPSGKARHRTVLPVPARPGRGRTPRRPPAAEARPCPRSSGNPVRVEPTQSGWNRPRRPPLTCLRAQPPRSSSAPPRPRRPTGQSRPVPPVLLDEPEPGPPSHWPTTPSVCPREHRVKGQREGR